MENRVEIGGVPAIVYRWGNDRIDVWVPYSAKSGPVVVKRAANTPKPDGTCCAEHKLLETEVGLFSVITPKIDSYNPMSGGLDDVVTIVGSGFGTFLKTAEARQGDYRQRLREGQHRCLVENGSTPRSCSMA